MHKTSRGMAFALVSLLLLWNDPAVSANETNLIEDPSFEESQEPNQFGHVFQTGGGWKYEGDCSFAVGQVAHSGKTSGLLRGATAPKIRLSAPDRELEPGRYRITAWIRGLDIGTGTYNATTEFMFDEKYMQLQKNGHRRVAKIAEEGSGMWNALEIKRLLEVGQGNSRARE